MRLLRFIFFIYLLFPLLVKGQEITATTDTTYTKIGLPITYKIKVEIDNALDKVEFPRTNQLDPWLYNTPPVLDTLVDNAVTIITKTYELSHFESGSVYIPSQEVLINNKVFKTDSISIEIEKIDVNIQSDKIYDIKSNIEVTYKMPFNWLNLMYILIALSILGVIIWWFFIRKKKEKEFIKRLSPLERALYKLNNLKKTKYIINSEFKTYYSSLTDIFRHYVEEELKISALESTSDELIEKLMQSQYDIEKQAIAKLTNVLKTADLAKFANISPDSLTSEKDTETITKLINQIYEILPDPTEEDFLNDIDYQKELSIKREKKRRLIIKTSIISLVSVMFIILSYSYLNGRLFGFSTKLLIESEWLESSYSFPPVTIETPEVLERKKNTIPAHLKSMIANQDKFTLGGITNDYYFEFTQIGFKLENQIDLKKIQNLIDITERLKQVGATNIVMKEEKYVGKISSTGFKYFGSFHIKSTKSKTYDYQVFLFSENNALQLFVFMQHKGDKYGTKVTNRILNSIQLKSAEDVY